MGTGFCWGKAPVVTGATLVSYKNPDCGAGSSCGGHRRDAGAGVLTVLVWGNWFLLPKTRQRAVWAWQVPTRAPGDVSEGIKSRWCECLAAAGAPGAGWTHWRDVQHLRLGAAPLTASLLKVGVTKPGLRAGPCAMACLHGERQGTPGPPQPWGSPLPMYRPPFPITFPPTCASQPDPPARGVGGRSLTRPSPRALPEP